MKVLHKDERAGSLKLLVESNDDLWHLHNIIRRGDTVSAVTFRRDEQKADKLRAERVEKKRMFLTLEVEEVEFHEFSDRLRVTGVIREGPQDLGAHHTFNLEAGSDLTIQKDIWNVADQQMVREAVESTRRPMVTFVSIEEGDATVASLCHYGVREAAHVAFNVPGKQYKTKTDKREFFAEVVEALAQAYDGKAPLVIIGPGFTKENLYSYGKEHRRELFQNVNLIATGNAGMVGIYEALKSGATVKVLEDTRVAQETALVERLLEEIRKEGLYAYGQDEVKLRLDAGAVQTVLVSDRGVREGRFPEILDKARDAGADITIISTSHDAGRRLEHLGGIAALLRYRPLA